MTERNGLSGRRAKRLLSPLVAMITLGGALFAMAGPAEASTIVGYACAYKVNLSLFGGPYGTEGCPTQTSTYASANSLSPAVTLPSGGSSSLITSTDSDGAQATYGPAIIFGGQYDANDNVPNSGQLSTTTTGISTVQSYVNTGAVGPAPFYANSVFSRCTASASLKTTQVVLSGAVVETSTDANGYPLTQVNVPNSPTPNYTVAFELNNVGDHGIVVFNEKITNGDGSITINAVHMYMQGPIALGDMVIGQATCGH